MKQSKKIWRRAKLKSDDLLPLREREAIAKRASMITGRPFPVEKNQQWQEAKKEAMK